MGQRGPKRKSQTMLQRRGSWLAQQRKVTGSREQEQGIGFRGQVIGEEKAKTPDPNPIPYTLQPETSLPNPIPYNLKPLPSPCPPPAWLVPEASAVWDQMVRLLADRLHPGDAFALGRYCAQLVQWRALWQDLQVHGWTELDPKTLKPLRRPATVLLRELGQSLLALERAFGLTPAARDRLDLPAPEPEPDAKDQFFR